MTKKIMIVEDDVVVAETIKDNIIRIGYKTFGIHHSSHEALEAIQKKQPDLILMDIKLDEEIDGIDTALKITENWDIPIVFLTAYADKETLERAKKISPAGYILKPYDQVELRKTIEIALAKHELEIKLKESEERFKSITESSFDCIFETDKLGKITYISNGATNIFGHSVEEMMGKNFVNFLDKKSIPYALKSFKKAIDTGVTQPIKIEAKRKDKSVVAVEINPIPILNKKKVQGTRGTIRDFSKIMESQELIDKTEAIYKTIVENTHDIIYTYSSEGIVEFISPQVTDFGYNQRDIVGKNILDFIHPEDRQNVLEDFQKTIASGKTFPSTFRIIKKDGEPVWIEEKGQVLVDYYGKVKSVTGMIRDITERKIYEEQLKQNEEKFQAVFDSSPDAIYLIDSAGNFYDGNKAAEEIIGVDKADIIGKNIAEVAFLKAKDLPKAIKLLANTMAGKKSGPEIYELVRKDNTTRMVEVVSYPITIGKEKYLLGLGRDVTERVDFEKQIKIERDNANRYLEIVGTMVIALDNNGVITMINSKGAKILEADKKDIVGKSWFDNFIPEDEAKQIKNVFKQIMDGEIKQVEYYENTILTSNGSKRIIAFHNSLITDSDGKIQGILSSGEDITDRINSEKAIKAYTKDLEKFNRLSVDRELKMVELKRKIKTLQEEIDTLKRG